MSSEGAPRRMRMWQRLRRVGVAVVVLQLFAVTYVIADTGGSGLGQTPPSLAWITLEDEKGINAWQYELSIDFKTGFSMDVLGGMWASFAYLVWDFYRSMVILGTWFLDWVISLEWLGMVVDPLMAVGAELQSMLTRFGLVPAFLTVAALFGGISILRGRIAEGAYEILMSAFVVALGATTLATPMALIAGQDGLIYEARDRTLEIVSEIDGDSSNAEESANPLTAQLITTFVRQPTQLVAFGKILDNGKCEQAYDAVVKAGPYGQANNDILDKVGECDSAAGEFAKSPQGSMFTSSLMLVPAGGIVILLGVLIGGSIMLSLVTVAISALKLILDLVVSVLPGGARRSLASSLAEVAVGIISFVVLMFVLAVYLRVIGSVFRSNSDEPSKAYIYVTVILVLGMIVFMRYRKQLAHASKRLTDTLLKKPGAPVAKPLPAGGGWKMAAGALGAYHALKSPVVRRAAAAVVGGPVGAAASTAIGAANTLGRVTGRAAGNAAGRAGNFAGERFSQWRASRSAEANAGPGTVSAGPAVIGAPRAAKQLVAPPDTGVRHDGDGPRPVAPGGAPTIVRGEVVSVVEEADSSAETSSGSVPAVVTSLPARPQARRPIPLGPPPSRTTQQASPSEVKKPDSASEPSGGVKGWLLKRREQLSSAIRPAARASEVPRQSSGGRREVSSRSALRQAAADRRRRRSEAPASTVRSQRSTMREATVVETRTRKRVQPSQERVREAQSQPVERPAARLRERLQQGARNSRRRTMR